MEVRFYIDPETGAAHTHRHQVEESEVEEVLARAFEDRSGREVLPGRSRQDARRPVSPGHLRAGSFGGLGVRDHSVPARAQGAARAEAPAQEKDMSQTKFPPGWDEDRVRRVLEHYEKQSDEEAVAEDEAAYESTTHTTMAVPIDLVPTVRELIAKRRAG